MVELVGSPASETVVDEDDEDDDLVHHGDGHDEETGDEDGSTEMLELVDWVEADVSVSVNSMTV